jgi:hypothetical protein
MDSCQRNNETLCFTRQGSSFRNTHSRERQGGLDAPNISSHRRGDESRLDGLPKEQASDLQLSPAAPYNALEDAGLKKSDVDGIFVASNTLGITEHIGIHPKFTDSIGVDGSSFSYTQGMPVELVGEDRTDKVSLPMFKSA